MRLFVTTAAAVLVLSSIPAFAAYAKGTIVETASISADHETLVAAVKAADLATALSAPGPFTVFAPTDAAFEKLPTGTVATLLKPENKSQLQAVLTYHVVAGRVSASELVAMIRSNSGQARLKTLQGGSLTASLEGEKVVIVDEKGGKATVLVTDLASTNGLIHVTDTVSMPD